MTRMNRLVFTQEPPLHWNDLCQRRGDLFNSPQWQDVLSQGFGSKTLYGWDEAAATGATITIFKAGPFRIGYLGFPVGGAVGNGEISPEMLLDLKDAHFPVKLHCIRMPLSAFASGARLPLPAQMTPETAIENLQEWQPEIHSKLYRDIKKAEKSAVMIINAEPSQGEIIYCLYQKTVSRNHGSMRYTLDYYCELINLAKKNPHLRCILAVKDDKVAGFLVVACHQRTAYYLHSGIDPEFKSFTPSDLLLNEAIKWAKQQGMESFNMMASPPRQPSLVRYKEKWGGVTRELQNYELALRPLQTMMFRTTSMVYQSMSSFFK